MSMDRAGDKIGAISVEQGAVRVRFKYDTDCFKVVSKLHGARFDRDSKAWLVPLVKVPDLLRAKPFSKDRFRYDFDEEKLGQELHGLERRIAEARSRAARSPFSVSEEDLTLLEFDVVLTSSSDGQWICHRASRSRAAKRFLKELPHAVYSKKERGFLTSSFFLNAILKRYRDSDFSFAVAEPLSKMLRDTAPIRSAEAGPAAPNDAGSLQRAMLLPFADFDPRANAFSLHGMNTEVRAKLRVRSSSAPRAPSAAEVMALRYRGLQERFPFFLTDSAQRAIEPDRRALIESFVKTPGKFPDEVVCFHPVPVSWRVDSSGMGGLEIASDIWEQVWSSRLVPLMREFSIVLGSLREGAVFLAAPPLRTPEFFEAAGDSFAAHGDQPPVSRDFMRFLEGVRGRARAMLRMSELQKQPDASIDIHDASKASRLYPHQRVAVSWLLDSEYGMLGDDMGLGKTLSVLTAFDELHARGCVDLLLVVCPNSLVRNWLRECSQWFPRLAAARLPDNKRERGQFLDALREQRIASIDVFVLNFESMRLDDVWPALADLCRARSVYLCVDESQRIKNPQSKSFSALREFGPLAKRRVLLSGTPTPKDITDIWTQMYILDGGNRFGKSYYSWLKDIAELGTKWSEFAVKKFLPGAVADAVSRVHEVLLRRKKEDVLSLPPKIFLFRDVELAGDQKKRFDRLRDELLVQVRGVGGKEGVRLIESLLEEYLRAVQMASNPRLIDPSWNGEPAKFVELDDIVSDIVSERGEKLVVWTNYLGNIAELRERYSRFGALAFTGEISTEERQEAVRRFQDPRDAARILLAIPAAGGVGITLTSAQTAVYLDRTWNAEHWLQSVDRIHRIGQTGTVRIIVLNASKVDELIGFNLKKKSEQMEQLLSGGDAHENLLPTMNELLEALR